MNDRKTFLAVMLVAALAILPLCFQGADAAEATDISITLPDDSAADITVTVGNGSSASFDIMVFNKSTDYLRMSATADSDSSHVTITSVSDRTYLSPFVQNGNDHIATVTVTVSVDRYDSEDLESGVLTLKFTDMAGETPSFTVDVPIVIDVDSEYYSENGANCFLGFIPNNLDGFLGSVWFTAIVTLVVWIVISLIVCQIVIPVFTKYLVIDKDDKKRKTKRSLTSLITLLIAVLAINQCLAILGVSPEFRDGFTLLSNILYVFIGALIVWVIYSFLVAFIIGKAEKGTDSAVDSTLIPLFNMIGKILIAVFAVGSALALFGVDMAGILVSAGVITLGITLGAQNVLSQFFSGIVILATRPFKKGDFVKIGGEVYIVRKVKLMFTEFDNWDKDQVVTIPNNVVSGGTIVNLTGEDEEARTFIFVKVKYGADVKKAEELMIQAAMEHPHIIKDGSRGMPSTRMTDVAGNFIEIRLAVYTDSFDNAGGYAGEIRGRIYELFDQNGIPRPPNAIDVYMKE